jgi:hypothetical protein
LEEGFKFSNSSNVSEKDLRKYYLKAHELLMMLENASEAENAGP